MTRAPLLLLLVAAACSPSPPEPAAAPAQAGLGPPDPVATIRQQHLPNIELTTHEGRRVRFYDDLVKGKVVAINFMFATCRNACPAATENLREVQKAFAGRADRNVTLLSISLDAERDTPAVLRGYAEAHRIGPGWYFLTGRRDEIDQLRRKLGAWDPDPVVDADPQQHTGLVIVGNEPRGRWRAISVLSKPVRIQQAIERVLLPPSQWPAGEAAVQAAPYEESAASQRRVGPPDAADLTLRD